ncbi:MAG: (Fe-S)-binding protein, partial [Candidatus Helarchaeota archaeon]
MDFIKLKLDLSKIRSDLYHCLHCHLCYAANWQKLDDWREICPTAARYGFEAFYSSGRLELARALIDGDLEEGTPRLLQSFYTCTGCAACMEQCHEYSGVKTNHIELFEMIKALLVSKGWGPLAKHADFAQSIAKYHNPYHEPHETRFNWLPEKLTSPNPLIYFTGCTSSYRRQEIAQATFKVLKTVKAPFSILGSAEWCCGSPLIRTGQLDLAEPLIAHNIEVIEKLGAEKVIFSCAGCYRTFKMDYPKLGYSLPFKIQHTTQYFLDLLRAGRLNIQSLEESVTYHDPCHLGRHARIFQQPRKILKKLGMNFQELPRSLKDAFCCGAGSGVRAAYPEFAKWTARNRLLEVFELN